jgi:hypothetical protein
MQELLEPKEITIEDKAYTISKFPAIAGREIITKYPVSTIREMIFNNKVIDYQVNEETMLKLMSYVAGGNPRIRLVTKELVDNHVNSWETLMRLELEMLLYNCSFFQDGRALTSLKGFAQNILSKSTPILTDLLEPFLVRIESRLKT